MKFRLALALASVLTVLAPSAAVMAQATTSCRAPTPPTQRPRRPSQVRVPTCLEFGNGQDCQGGEIDDYNRDVARYNSQVQSFQQAQRRYVNELNEYVRNASAYAQCEIDNLSDR